MIPAVITAWVLGHVVPALIGALGIPAAFIAGLTLANVVLLPLIGNLLKALAIGLPLAWFAGHVVPLALAALNAGLIPVAFVLGALANAIPAFLAGLALANAVLVPLLLGALALAALKAGLIPVAFALGALNAIPAFLAGLALATMALLPLLLGALALPLILGALALPFVAALPVLGFIAGLLASLPFLLGALALPWILAALALPLLPLLAPILSVLLGTGIISTLVRMLFTLFIWLGVLLTNPVLGVLTVLPAIGLMVAELLLWGVFTLISAIVFVGVVLFTAFSVLGDLLAWVFSLVFGILDPLPIGSVVAFTISDINRKEAIAKAVGALLYLDALFLAVLD